MERRSLLVLRGLLAGVGLVALVVGLPLVLVREVGWPLPTTMPSWAELSHTISTGAIEDATIIKALAVLVWLSWANFTSGVVVEAMALARGRAARRHVGLRTAQHLAAQMLATVSVAAALLMRPVTAAEANPSELRLPVASMLAEQPPPIIDATDHDTPPVRLATDASSTTVPGGRPHVDAEGLRPYRVQRGDTLWDLAERFLGDGMRWREIRDLNVGRAQPDGDRVGTDTEELRSGWTLLLPGRSRPGQADGEAPERDAIVVEQGDTLWDLADEHLDDPHRWPEIYEESRGDRQPDGGSLTHPDLIRPGWVLDLPSATPAYEAVVEPPEADAGGPPASHGPEEDEDSASKDRGPDIVDRDESGPSPDRHHEAWPPREATTAPTTADEPGSDERSVSEGEDDIAIVPIVAAGTVAAGLVLTLDRIRRTRLRRREPHQRIPLPTGSDRRAEQHLRGQADPDASRFVNLALRELSGHCAPHRPTPPVALVSYGPADVAVHLETTSDASPEGWERSDGDCIWTRHHPTDLATLEPHAGTPSRFPALVTVGAFPDGRVGLLNLAEAGCLHLAGDEEIARRLLSAWALELATTPRADALDVVTIGVDGLPTGLERLTTLDDPDQLRDLLGHPHSNGQTSAPRTVVLARCLPSDLNVLLRTTSELRPDLVAVTTDLQPRSGNWSLRLERGGRARLEPKEIAFELLDMGAEAVPMTAKLIEQALHDPDQLVPFPDSEELPSGESNLDEPAEEEGDTDAVAEADDEEPSIDVRILGPVEIVGEVEPFRTNKTIELIVYLALHRSGADADTLLEALWPEQEPRPARLYTEASRARKSLGRAANGSAHFPDAELGRYRLSPSVGLDYERFATAVAAARREPDRAIDHLRGAMLLVRGVPLSATATEYAWATNELYGLTQEVVDAAHDLAQLCLKAERYDDATWAAERGLLTDPLAEILVRDLMEAAAATGNTARVHAAMTRLRRQVGEEGDANDADDWLQPDTVATFERACRGAGSARVGSG